MLEKFLIEPIKSLPMKKLALLLFLFTTLQCFSQDDDKKDKNEKKGFKKENLFTGGDVTASFFNGTTVLGIDPYFGYSLNRWIDVAAIINFNYTSERDYQVYGDKLRQTIYGPGAFVRIFPFNFLFAQAQYEYNLIHLKYIPANNSGYVPSKLHLHANSLLLGGGYSGGTAPAITAFIISQFCGMWLVIKILLMLMDWASHPHN